MHDCEHFSWSKLLSRMIPSMGCLYEIGLIFRPKFSILPHSLASNFNRNLFRLANTIKRYLNKRLASTASIFRVSVNAECSKYKKDFVALNSKYHRVCCIKNVTTFSLLESIQNIDNRIQLKYIFYIFKMSEFKNHWEFKNIASKNVSSAPYE